ncbi:MAG: histidinol dehydrogenase [Candidatus Caldarchaeum sp.]|nr:histidinol dehydrogenase [Candidatus Caldarchaeum sp.]
MEKLRFFRVSKDTVHDAVAEISSSRKPLEYYVEVVRRIVEEVKTRGDAALIGYVKRFDSPHVSLENLRVPREQMLRAYTNLDERTRKALRKSAENIAKLSQTQLNRLNIKKKIEEGVLVLQRPSPLPSVGCYVPGGAAAYPSTALMTVVPAKVANVPRKVVCTPPDREGKISDIVLAALHVAGADEVYAVGGAHAIAAMAYGTETIKPVSKVLGPGGPFVTAAKKIVGCDVLVDMLAGPTELLVYGDDVGDAEDVALEMCAQAEHSEDTFVGLVTTSDELVNEVLKFIKLITPRLERRETIEKALEKNGYFVVCDTVKTAITFIQSIAPEHLYIPSRHEKITPFITNAGLISAGKHTSPTLCDYVAGVNHVLPTSGQATIRGGLNIIDYVKIVTEVRIMKGAAKRLGKYAAILAKAEGLTAHAAAASK